MQLKRFCAKYISLAEAFLWCARHRLLGRQKKSLMLHSMFRSGSTYFFNTFRKAGGFWCYYEPLHHQLIELKPDRLDIFPFDKKTTSMMSHPELGKPHFYEFKEVLQGGHIPFFNVNMSYREFSSVRQHARMYKYIMTLLVRAPEKRVPVLQFNRSSLRIGWFKWFFKDSLHVFILRNPRDQFESYFKQGKKYNIFLAINLYIVAANAGYKKFHEAYSYYSNDFQVTHDLYYDLKQLAYFSEQLKPEDHYRVFMHLWVCSLIEATRKADLIVDVDRLSSSGTYRTEIIGRLQQDLSVDDDLFSDCAVSSYAAYSMEKSTFKTVEEEVRRSYARELEVAGCTF